MLSLIWKNLALGKDVILNRDWGRAVAVLASIILLFPYFMDNTYMHSEISQALRFVAAQSF